MAVSASWLDSNEFEAIYVAITQESVNKTVMKNKKQYKFRTLGLI